MHRVFKSKHVEGMTAEKSYSYSDHYLLLDANRTVLCQVPCDQIEGLGKGTSGWEEVIEEPEYEEKIFKMEPAQVKKFEAWRNAKNEKIRRKGELPNNCYTYSFTPTGVGLGVEVSCTDGTKIDLSDYENW
jgi:hypothetical protein